MGRKYGAMNVSREKLEAFMKLSRSAPEFRRLQAVYLRIVCPDMPVEQIAEIVCWSASWVRQLHCDFNKKGIEALLNGTPGGSYRNLMSKTEGIELISKLAKERGSISEIDVNSVKSAIEKRVGRKIHISTAYRFLARHGWHQKTSHFRISSEIDDTTKKNIQMIGLARKTETLRQKVNELERQIAVNISFPEKTSNKTLKLGFDAVTSQKPSAPSKSDN